MLLFRSGWGNDDAVGMFKVGPLFIKNHDHLDRLSFQLYCRGALAIETARSASRNRYARVQRSMEQLVLPLSRLSDGNIRWQLAGGLWLLIGGLLLTGLILSI